MLSRLSAGLVIALLGLGCGLASTEPAVRMRKFDIPKLGVLTLPVPSTWSEEGPKLEERTLADVSFMVHGNPDFQMLISALDGSSFDIDRKISLVVIKERVQAAGEKWLPTCVEKFVDIQALDGSDFRGFYFSMTDRAEPLPAGEFRHVTQGLGQAGNILIGFTIYWNDREEPRVHDGLTVLRGIRYEKL
jgi:hypothetical protein